VRSLVVWKSGLVLGIEIDCVRLVEEIGEPEKGHLYEGVGLVSW
jgi:hypothetical protein